LLITFAAMRLLDVPATIMSFAGVGIALGLAVDADVVALEACHRRLEVLPPDASPAQRRGAILAASGSFAPAILTSLGSRPCRSFRCSGFTGETGRLLRPLVATKTLVVVAAGLVALTLAPALRAVVLRGRVKPELDNPVTRLLVRGYRPFVHFALSWPAVTLVTALLAVLSCLPILSRLGGEFLPRIDEGDLLFMPTTLPGVSPELAERALRKQDRAIAAFKEVATVFGKVGRADTATDPAPFSMAETTVAAAAARAMAEARQDAVVQRLGAPAAAARALPGVAGGDATDDGRAGGDAGSRDAPARLDQRLDRAGAGAHRHDGDGRPNPGGDPDRRHRTGAAGRRRSCGARGDPGRARDRKRRPRVPRR
jgi:Cu/Ag efflux pump CusA